jgi:GT2 family glycosyltransferase
VSPFAGTGPIGQAASRVIGVRPVLCEMTVVIPTLGRPILEECLFRIATGTSWPAQLIVVDQSGSPAVAGWLEALHAHGLHATHVTSSQRGKAAALNRGIERVQTASVAITDDDCFVESDWLEKMAAHLRDHSTAIVTGPAYPTGPEEPVAAVTVRSPSVQSRPGLQFDLFCGSNAGARLTTFHEVGWFDEDPCFVAAAEDCEWAYRALRHGIAIVYAPDVVVHHVGWRTPGERSDRYLMYARSHGSFYGKYLRQGDWRMAVRVLLHHARALKRWVMGAIRGNREQMLNGRAYFTGLLPGIVTRLRGEMQHEA